MADLFTVSELASYLQRDLDTSSATLARDSAQAIVRGYCHQELSSTTYTDALLPISVETVDGIGGSYVVRFPQQPVTAVTSVAVSGVTYVSGTDYAWNGYAPFIRLRSVERSSDTFEYYPVATVTYTAGFATVPAEVKAVALSIAARQYDNPTGIRQQTIDDYSVTRAGADDDLAGVSLLRAEERVLRRYRPGAVGSLVVR